MNRTRSLWVGALVAVAAVGISCRDTIEPPREGPVTVSLATPRADDGAVLITVTGPGVGTLAPANSSYTIFWRLVSTTELRAIVLGNVVAGPLFTMRVPDIGNVSGYAGTVTQVANRTDELQEDRAGYGVQIAAAEAP